LAVQRGFNEGGYFPDRVDHENPPSPVKETATDEGISLAYHSDFDLDPDFTACLMQRQSIRSFSRHPLTKQQLEQFLQLSARANAIVETPDLGWISYRHYPSPGGRHALEIYPVVFNIEDIDAGLYHYNPVLHCLEPMQSTPQLRELLWQNTLHKMGTAATGSPAVLFIVSAVFARTCWKYRGMPYQAVLMETGALYQTMYLVATQLGLAPCGIGAFPELATAEILQLDPLDEAQTGLFVLGLPDDEAHDTLTIHRVRLLDHPPYAIQWNNKVLELTFRQGMKEVIAPERLALYTTDSGVLSCRVMGGRHRAGFEPGAEAEILRILRPEK
jgi:SagB-type dehydrogenase family enzyme